MTRTAISFNWTTCPPRATDQRSLFAQSISVQSRAKKFITLFAPVMLLAVAANARAQEGCALRLDQRVLELGEMIPAELVCVNIPQPDTPQTTVPDGLDLRLLSAVPSQMSQTSIINGRVTRESRYTFSLQLTGMREGAYTLDPIRVDAEGKTYETEPVQVVVRRTELASAAKGDRLVFVELNVEPTTLYVTQEYTASLTIGIRKVVIGGRSYDVDLLRQVLDLRSSQLSIFSGGQARQSEITLTDAQGEQHSYVVYRVDQRVRADDIGTERIGPVFIKARYPTAVARTVFRRLESTDFENVFARAEAVDVTVKGPPVQGRPDSFTGAVGRYLFDVTVKPTHIEQGEPVTMTFTIQGAPLEGVAGPNLAAHPELTSRFDFVQDELVGDVEGGAKTFRRAIFPKQAGEQTVPAIEWSYFDPNNERYVTLKSDPVAISVDRKSGGSESTVALLPRAESEADAPTLTVVAGGLAANYVDPDLVLADAGISVKAPVLIGVLALPPVLCLVVTLTSRHRARLRGDVGFARRRRARAKAEATIRRAMGNGAPPERLALLGDAMTGYLCDRFNVSSAALTPAEARDVLKSQRVDGALTDEVVEFLSTCDAVQYAPGLADNLPTAQACDRVRDWIKRIEVQS